MCVCSVRCQKLSGSWQQNADYLNGIFTYVFWLSCLSSSQDVLLKFWIKSRAQGTVNKCAVENVTKKQLNEENIFQLTETNQFETKQKHLDYMIPTSAGFFPPKTFN